MRSLVRVLLAGAGVSIKELSVVYPPVVYFGAWIPRILAQLAFFALLVGFAGGTEWLGYALVGNAVYLVVQTCVSYISGAVVVERYQGAFPLIAASPTHPLLVLAGRNIGLALHAYATGLLSLAIAVVVTGPYPISTLIATPFVLLASVASAYMVGLLIGALALRGPNLHNLLSNGILLLILAIAGVNVPVSALPSWLAQIAQFLPLTHGLSAVRMTLIGGDGGTILREVSLELGIGLLFAAVALLLFNMLFRRARRDGSLSLV